MTPKVNRRTKIVATIGPASIGMVDRLIGAGLDKTGIMTKVAGFILKVGGTTETRIIPIISSTVGIIWVVSSTISIPSSARDSAARS